MITIFFPAGSFGSTLEYIIRNYSKEFESVNAEICNTGSMHSLNKEFHPCKLSDFRSLKPEKHQIITPVWPGKDLLDPQEYVKKVTEILPAHNIIFVCLKNQKQYELNELFCFYKTQDYITDTIGNYKNWNKSYESVKDMSIWEIRESLSLIFFNSKRYFSLEEQNNCTWFIINPEEILYNLPMLLPKILEYLNLTPDNLDSFKNFYNNWFNAQEYILNEYDLIQRILKNFENNEYIKWDKLSIVSEAIVQTNLFKMGYNLKCFDLDVFPTDTYCLKQISTLIKD